MWDASPAVPAFSARGCNAASRGGPTPMHFSSRWFLALTPIALAIACGKNHGGADASDTGSATAGSADGGGCASDELDCGGGCIDPASNPNNCGECGNECMGRV